jgi:hypothetical protein
MSRKKPAPRARPEFVDVVTGLPARPGPGSIASGRVVARVRPTPAAPITSVAVQPDELDYTRSSIPVLADHLEAVLTRAKQEASYSDRPPLKRSEFVLDEITGKREPGAKLLASLGVRSTFDDVDAAVRELDALGDWDEHTPGQVDSTTIAEWVREQRIDIGAKWKKVGRTKVFDANRKTVSLAQTPAGKRIIGKTTGASGSTGGQIFFRALRYLLGRALNRRWAAVDWHAVESLIEALNSSPEVEYQNLAAFHLVIPLGAGPSVIDNYRGAIREQLGDDAVYRYAAVEDAARLWSVADDLRAIANPPKGEAGAEYRELRKCISKDDLARLPKRVRQIEHLAARPWDLPPSLCDLEAFERGLPCHLSPVVAEATRLRGSCASRTVETAPATAAREYALRSEGNQSGLHEDDWMVGREQFYADEDEPEAPPLALAVAIPEPILAAPEPETRVEAARRHNAERTEQLRRIVAESVQPKLGMDLEPDAAQSTLDVFGLNQPIAEPAAEWRPGVGDFEVSSGFAGSSFGPSVQITEPSRRSSATGISSTDPEAIPKLRVELDAARTAFDRAKGRARVNARAKVDRIERRIEDLERQAQSGPPADVVRGPWRATWNVEAERVQITGPKPKDAAERTARRALFRGGWNWSPKNVAWQRKATPAAWESAQSILRSLVPGGVQEVTIDLRKPGASVVTEKPSAAAQPDASVQSRTTGTIAKPSASRTVASASPSPVSPPASREQLKWGEVFALLDGLETRGLYTDNVVRKQINEDPGKSIALLDPGTFDALFRAKPGDTISVRSRDGGREFRNVVIVKAPGYAGHANNYNLPLESGKVRHGHISGGMITWHANHQEITFQPTMQQRTVHVTQLRLDAPATRKRRSLKFAVLARAETVGWWGNDWVVLPRAEASEEVRHAGTHTPLVVDGASTKAEAEALLVKIRDTPIEIVARPSGRVLYSGTIGDFRPDATTLRLLRFIDAGRILGLASTAPGEDVKLAEGKLVARNTLPVRRGAL